MEWLKPSLTLATTDLCIEWCIRRCDMFCKRAWIRNETTQQKSSRAAANWITREREESSRALDIHCDYESRYILLAWNNIWNIRWYTQWWCLPKEINEKKTEAYKIETTMKYVFSVHSNRWKTGFFREEYVYMETVSQAEKRLTHTHGEVTEKEVHT